VDLVLARKEDLALARKEDLALVGKEDLALARERVHSIAVQDLAGQKRSC